MAKLTTDALWTQTLASGTYDIQKKGTGDVYVGRGVIAPTTTDDALHLSGATPLRLEVKSGDTAYFYGNGVDLYYYATV